MRCFPQLIRVVNGLLRRASRKLRSEMVRNLVRAEGKFSIGSDWWITCGENIFFGDGFFARSGLWIEAFGNGQICIGKRVSAGRNLHIGALSKVQIGDDTLIGSDVTIIDHDHGEYSEICGDDHLLAPQLRPLRSKGEIRIGERVWVADKVVILGGVSIGNGVVIGAGSVVTRDLPDNCIAAGAPATPRKVMRDGKWESINGCY